MGYAIREVEITPNPATTKQQIKITVSLVTWDYLKRNYTWKSLNESGKTWGDLKK